MPHFEPHLSAPSRSHPPDPTRGALQRIVRGAAYATRMQYAEIVLFADRLADFGVQHGNLPGIRSDLRLLCARVPAQHGHGVFSVPDLAANLDLVAAAPPGIRFFAHVPVSGAYGRTYGALVVLNPVAHWLSPEDERHLVDFAAVASALLDAAAAAGQARATETAFAGAQAHLRTLSGLASDVLLLFEDGCLVDANPAATRLFGLQHPGPLLGRPASDLADPADAAAFQHRCDARSPGPFSLVLSDGEARPVQLQAQAEPIPHSARSLYLVVARPE